MTTLLSILKCTLTAFAVFGLLLTVIATVLLVSGDGTLGVFSLPLPFAILPAMFFGGLAAELDLED